MDWQETTALLIVAATAGAFAWRKFRRRKFRLERDTHCGCPSQVRPEDRPPSIMFRARKGARPQVIVKMK